MEGKRCGKTFSRSGLSLAEDTVGIPILNKARQVVFMLKLTFKTLQCHDWKQWMVMIWVNAAALIRNVHA